MYSQNKEEEVILKYFGDEVGNFLDIGSNDGITFSNTRALALNGWKGIFVDPSPKAIERCRNLYKNSAGYYFYPYAIGTRNGKAILNESGPLCSADDIGLVSTFHAHEMERFKRIVKYDPIEVKTFRWKTFLNRLKIREFQMISIDAEGSDVDILRQIDLFTVKLLVIEWNSIESARKEILEYTSKFQLNNIIYISAENLVICK